MGLLPSVLDLWPGLDAVAVSNSSYYESLRVPSLSNVSVTFPSSQALKKYILQSHYGSDPSLPLVSGCLLGWWPAWASGALSSSLPLLTCNTSSFRHASVA